MDLENKRILVIGGAGFIGSHVVDELIKTDVSKILIYDDFSRGSLKNLESALQDSRVRIFEHGGDILQTDVLDKVMEGVDAVFHLAALWILHCHEYPRSAFEVNIRGTFNVIEACIKHEVARLIYSSSASVYGDALEIPMTEEHPYNNFTFYGATKISGEHMLKSLGRQHGLSWVGLRYMNVYGPRQDYKGAYTAVMMKILDRLDEGLRPVVYGDGSQQYDFITVEDIARANVLALKSDVSGSCYNIGRGIGTSIKELSELLVELYGANADIQYEPAGMTFVTNRIGSTAKAKEDLSFVWKDDLSTGLKHLIEWRRGDKAMTEGSEDTVPSQLLKVSRS